jgi:hypothetical protein
MWWIQPQEIADEHGKSTGRWRMTARSDEGGGGPFGNTSHDHATAEEAEKCDACDEYTARCSGFYSRKQLAEMKERAEREQLHRLKEKYETRVDGLDGHNG